MKSSHRFRLAGLFASGLSVILQTAGIAAEVGWSSPAATDSPAASLWLNDATGATTYSQGLLRLDGSRDGLVITAGGDASGTGNLSLSGPTSVTRTDATTGTQTLDVGTATTSGEWRIDGSGKLVVNAAIVDPLGDVSRITKSGAGALVLSAPGTYSGGTTLSQGTLVAGNNRSFGTGALALNGGTLASPGSDETTRTFANGTLVGANMTFGDTLNSGNVAFSSTVDLQGAVRTFTTAANVTFDGVVANGGVVKAGAAALTMTGINSYAGGTTLSEGTLFAGSNSAFGTGNLVLGSTMSPTISSDGSGDAASRTFANAVTITGDVTFGNGTNDGAMVFAASANLGDTGENRAFTVNAKTTFAGGISGGAGLTKLGDGVLTLSGSNSYSGGTTFAAGMIRAGSDNAFGTGALVFKDGAIGSADGSSRSFANSVVFVGDVTVGDYVDSMGALSFTSQVDLGGANRRITTKANATFSGPISNGAITKDGLGALILTGSNTYAGGTTLTEGSLLAANDFAFGTGVLNLNGGVIGSNGGTRSFNNDVAMAAGTVQFGDSSHLDALTFNGNTSLAAGRHTFNTVADTTFNGVIAGQGASLVKDGTGILTFNNSNTYDGGTELRAGTVRVASDRSLGAGTITFNGGTLASAGSAPLAIANNVFINGNATIGDNSNSGAVHFRGTSNELSSGFQTITTNVATVFENGLSGSGGLIKDGTATLTLRGDSTYAGDTWIHSGKLVINGSLSSPRIHIDAGATLGGTFTFNGVIEGPGTFAPGNSPGITTTSQIDPSGGTDYAFEFTQVGAPTWSSTSAPGNDVSRITGTPAFAAPMTSANVISLYFNSSLGAPWTSVLGGFFVDGNTNSLASAIAGAAVNYNFQTTSDAAGAFQHGTEGNWYVTEAQARVNGLLPPSGQSFVLRTKRVDSADFAFGVTPTPGFSMEIVSVPEPSTIALGAIAAVAAMARHRRVRGYLARLRLAVALR